MLGESVVRTGKMVRVLGNVIVHHAEHLLLCVPVLLRAPGFAADDAGRGSGNGFE